MREARTGYLSFHDDPAEAVQWLWLKPRKAVGTPVDGSVVFAAWWFWWKQAVTLASDCGKCGDHADEYEDQDVQTPG